MMYAVFEGQHTKLCLYPNRASFAIRFNTSQKASL